MSDDITLRPSAVQSDTLPDGDIVIGHIGMSFLVLFFFFIV